MSDVGNAVTPSLLGGSMDESPDNGQSALSGMIDPDWANSQVLNDAQIAAAQNSPLAASLGLDLTTPIPQLPGSADGSAAPIPMIGTGGQYTDAVWHSGMDGTANPVILAANEGRAAAQSSATKPPDWLDPKTSDFLNPQSQAGQFFDQQYQAILPVAKQLGVDPSLILGLAGHESAWGTHPIGQNNYFGFTPHGDSSRGPDFPSLDEAWQQWGKQVGPRVAGVGSDSQAFVNALQQDNRQIPNATDNRGKYNTEDSNWADEVRAAIDSVQKRLPGWM